MFNNSTNILLGAIAGLTIFLGLPIAKWTAVSERTRGLLALASAGILLFLVIEVGYHAMEMVEVSVKSRSNVLVYGALFAGGLLSAMLGLALVEQIRRGSKSSGASPFDIAFMIALGIGLHNFAEGLAIGQSFSAGALQFGTVLVIGFALHNATEGFGIAGPLLGQPVRWSQLFWLGIIGGAPTIAGAWLGGIWVNPFVELLCLSLAAGSLIYVTAELLKLRLKQVTPVGAMSALAVGLLVGFSTELIVAFAQSADQTQARVTTSLSVSFGNTQSNPSGLQVQRGARLTLINDSNTQFVFEGNGLFVAEVVLQPHSRAIVTVSGTAGTYRLQDEQGKSAAAKIEVMAASVAPEEEKTQALSSLTILEGHIRASKDLHDRGASKQGPDPELDFKRAGKHAGHPHHELFAGEAPPATSLQKQLRQAGQYEQLDQALRSYMGCF